MKIFPLFLAIIILPLINAREAEASALSPVNATVKISFCGGPPFIIEDGEDCERDGSLNGETCKKLGFDNGTLACDISCTFDTSGCVAPSIDPTDIPPDKVDSLLAAGLFSKPSSDSIASPSSLQANNSLTINIPLTNGTSRVNFPKDVVMTRTDGENMDPTALTATEVAPSSLSGFAAGLAVDGALQWGIPNVELQFDLPLNLTIFVGTILNGQTLNVLRSTDTSSGWTNNGIVSPATCTVSAGECSFQATKASYFATTRTGGSLGSSSSSSSSVSSPSAPGCPDTPPGSAPDLFQINVTDTNAKLYFSPAGKPYNKYFISYGHSPNAEQFGFEFNKTNYDGVTAQTINALAPNNTYYLKVRGGNGCATGAWSNIMKIKTNARYQKRTTIFYKNMVTALKSTAIKNYESATKEKPLIRLPLWLEIILNFIRKIFR